jgi:hypothetical protein
MMNGNGNNCGIQMGTGMGMKKKFPLISITHCSENASYIPAVAPQTPLAKYARFVLWCPHSL